MRDSKLCVRKDSWKQIIRQIVKAYRAVYEDHIHAILLYGSYASGDYDNQSDIYLATIIDGERMDLQEKLVDVWEEAADSGLLHDTVISPVVIPYDEFNQYKGKLPYYRNIEAEGRKVG